MTKPPQPRFLVTAELSKLARWLRLLGFDASIARSGKIRDWVRVCTLQNRILLSRVRKNAPLQIYKRFMVIESDAYPEQLKQVVAKLGLGSFNVFSRCLYCNRVVYPIEKEKIAKRLPEKVKNRERNFTQCRKCGKIFWKGTHFEAMLKTLNEILYSIAGKDIGGFVLTEFS
jgi:uncharacterized protein with PIN domain